MALLAVLAGAWQPGPPVTRGGGPGVAGPGCGREPGRGFCPGRTWSRWCRALALGLFPMVGDGFVPPLKAVAELRGVVGRHPAPRARMGRSAVAQLLSLSPSPGCSLAALSREGPCPIPSRVPWGWHGGSGCGAGCGAVPAPLCQSLEPDSSSSPRPAQLLVKPCHQPLL